MNTRYTVRLAALVAALQVAGCDPPPELPADARVRIDTIAGIEHVVSGDRGAWAAGGAWHVDPAGLVIGHSDGRAEESFGRVAGIALDAAGRVFIGDSRAGEVRVFDGGGGFVRRIGRPGAGPGEFRDISGIARAPDGIAVLDGRLGRVTIFTPDGEPVRAFRLERPYPVTQTGALMRFDRRGRFYDRTPLDPSPRLDDIAIMVYDPRGELAGAVRVATVERDSGPFAAKPSVAVGPDGFIYFARGDEYRITVLSPAGDTARVLRRRVRPRPVSPAERDSARAMGIDRPETKPVISELHVDDAGHLWVGRYGDPSWSHMEWGIHAPDGRYLGALATPLMRVMHIGAGEVAGVLADEPGAEGVTVERVTVLPIRK